MATTKSTSLTNLDASPPIYPSAGAGAQTYLYELDDSAAVTSGLAANDLLKVIRVPTHALMKSLSILSTAFAATTLTVDVGLYYSDNAPFDGSNPNNSGIVNSQSTIFASAYSIGTAVMTAPVDILYQSGTFVPGNEQTPLWSVAGLTSDPGGFFDVVVKAHTVSGAVTAGSVMVKATYSVSGAL